MRMTGMYDSISNNGLDDCGLLSEWLLFLVVTSALKACCPYSIEHGLLCEQLPFLVVNVVLIHHPNSTECGLLLSTKVDPPNLAFCANKATSIFIQLWKDAILLSISDGVNHLSISSPSLAYADHVEITWANKGTIWYLIVCLLEVLVKLWNWQRHSCTSYVMLSIECPTVPSCGEDGITVGGLPMNSLPMRLAGWSLCY